MNVLISTLIDIGMEQFLLVSEPCETFTFHDSRKYMINGGGGESPGSSKGMQEKKPTNQTKTHINTVMSINPFRLTKIEPFHDLPTTPITAPAITNNINNKLVNFPTKLLLCSFNTVAVKIEHVPKSPGEHIEMQISGAFLPPPF